MISVAEYTSNDVQQVALNNPILFTASIPCPNGNVYHADETGIFILKGKASAPNRFARYQVTFNGNIAVTEGGTVTPIAVSLAVNGEPKLTSRAIVTPAAAENFGNVTSTTIIDVPAGCCFSVSVRYVSGSNDPTVIPTPVIDVQNANLEIVRTA